MNSKYIRAAAAILVTVLLCSTAASAACGRWVVRETTDYLSDPTFDVLSGEAADVQESAGQDSTGAAGDEESEVSADSATDPAYGINSSIDISGR